MSTPPANYFTLGRVFPRGRLREGFNRRQRRRRRNDFDVALFPSTTAAAISVTLSAAGYDVESMSAVLTIAETLLAGASEAQLALLIESLSQTFSTGCGEAQGCVASEIVGIPMAVRAGVSDLALLVIALSMILSAGSSLSDSVGLAYSQSLTLGTGAAETQQLVFSFMNLHTLQSKAALTEQLAFTFVDAVSLLVATSSVDSIGNFTGSLAVSFPAACTLLDSFFKSHGMTLSLGAVTSLTELLQVFRNAALIMLRQERLASPTILDETFEQGIF